MKDNKIMLSIRHRTLLSMMLVALVFLWLGANDAILADDFGLLVGRWQRTDGGYVIEVRRIHADGQMEAGYYNPRPINVARAQASVHGDQIKVELELRDKGYPGSVYTLVYAADKDVLFGNYYHALSRQYLGEFLSGKTGIEN